MRRRFPRLRNVAAGLAISVVLPVVTAVRLNRALGLIDGAFYIIMIIISLIYQMGGSFIDDLAFMVLATPIFYPVIIKLGFDPIWFGALFIMMIQTSYLTPPMAPGIPR